MTLPPDVDITQLSATYLSATIRDLKQQVASKNELRAELNIQIGILKTEMYRFEHELELRATTKETTVKPRPDLSKPNLTTGDIYGYAVEVTDPQEARDFLT